MKSNYVCFRGKASRVLLSPALLLLFTLGSLVSTGLQAQVLIDPAGDGGFNNGTTFTANNWITYNSFSPKNTWSCGGGGQPASFDNRSAFISDDGGVSWNYSDNALANVAHLYRFVTFPAGVNGFTLEFDWQSNGEADYDYLLVSLAPQGNTGLDPVETLYSNINNPGSINDKLPPPAMHLARLRSNSKQHAKIDIPQWMIGNCSESVIKKLVFTWVNDAGVNVQKPAIIDNVSLVGYSTPVSAMSISHPADVCITGTDPIWVANPEPYLVSGTKGEFKIVSGSSSNAIVNTAGATARLNLNKASAGRTIVQYIYQTNTGCVYTIKDTINIFETPVSNLKNTYINCLDVGSVLDLRTMFQGKTSQGGVFKVVEAANPAHVFPVDSIYLTVPPGGGCFTVKYTVPDPHNCAGGPVSDSKSLLLTTKPKPALTFSKPKYICQAGGVVPVTVDRSSTGDHPEFTLNGNPATLGVTYPLIAPASRGVLSYEFCLKERNSAPGNCSGMPGVSSFLCSDSICERIIVYNDGNGCATNSPFLSECFPDFDLTDPCPIATRPNMELSCGVITIPAFNVLEARLTEETNLVFCDEDSLEVSYQGSLPGVFGDIVSGGQTFREMGGQATEIVCDVITFTIPLGPFGDIDPLPLGPYEELCDQTISQFVFSYLGDLIGGDDKGGGGYIVADTDGDGAFDVVLKDYSFPAKGQVRIPNNVKTAKGTITVRNVTGWPNKPQSACGVVAPDGINLLDILPIGTFPVLGSMIEDILDALSCDIPLDFSDQKTVEIPVINTTPPLFADCNPAGYAFSEDLACKTSANWSVPVAYDGCNGDLLAYKGFTAGVNTTYFAGAPVAPVTVTGSGVYQTAGPVPGSDLPAGTYSVTYTAYSCGGVTSTCTFPVVVTPGNPVLACPNNLLVKTDVDECRAVVTGLTPRQGLGCATIINYGIDYPTVPGFNDVFLSVPFVPANLGTHLDASGRSFPLGVSTVSYNMLVDINGNGTIDGGNESQTCTFTVTVADAQKPEAHCSDVEVQLNNQGTATVFAVNQNNGSVFINGGSFDNCDANPTIQIAKPGGAFASSVSFDCSNVGNNLVNLRVTDDFNNIGNCIANVRVKEFFQGIQMTMNLPELCLEANNPVQFDFANYLSIYLPNGQTIKHSEVASNGYLGDAQGFFGISAFLPHPGSPSNNPGTITSDGVYTPGTGTGYVTISYVLALPGISLPNGNAALGHCYAIVHATFELRQPLKMSTPECACVMENKRIVDLGVVTGGLEPYTIHYTDGVLDVNGDGITDDADGTYTFDESHGFNIHDFTQDIGELRVVYTPHSNWSVKIVDARGCEVFRSGSCDNADAQIGPAITCPASNNTLTTEEFACESQYNWIHPTPSDNCGIALFEYRIKNPDGTLHGPINLNASLYQAPSGSTPSGFFEGNYDFELGTSVVTYYAEDGVGNSQTCTFQVTVSDQVAPRFLNCPAPPVVQDAESGHCDAYVDFALPLAADNCSVPSITKIDNTGLNTGSRFPVGTTILYWEAKDPFGNKDTCQIKVIVNDYWQVPALSCPANKLQNNDPALCGAVVNNIGPSVSGPCVNNYGVTYSIYADAALTQRKDAGVSNASGKFFDTGDSWVKYTVQNQPLLLITEVSQSGAIDRIEISNLGPAIIDISCLEIKRVSGNAAANQTLGPISLLPTLAPSLLPVGGTRVFNFAFNGAANLPACYTISYMGAIFDEVSTNGFAGCNGFAGTLAGGDVIRKYEDDTDSAADWVLAENCYPLTLGAINPDLQVMPANGTRTALQSIEANKVSCTSKITVRDTEKPFCGRLTGYTIYTGPAIPNISASTCNRSTITIPASNCLIGDIVFNVSGSATPLNSTMTLISPSGTKVVITELPDDSLSTLFAQKAEGVWTLDVVPFPGQNPTVTGWSLNINCLGTFNVADQVLSNQTGVCGAPFTWTHPYFADNCFTGNISVAYTTTNAGCLPTGGNLAGTLVKGGYATTQFFCVGTTKVSYTLTDAAGNTEICSFLVTVKDVEKPKLTCTSDMVIHLLGGECGKFINYQPASATDNCAVVDTIMTPASGSWFPIGNTVVTTVIHDPAGNATTCSFNINVVEYVPSSSTLSCNDLVYVSIDETCTGTIQADDVLEGDNYHCYDDYVVSLKDNTGVYFGNTVHAANIGHTYVVRVTDPETGNSCWGTVKIEDKLAPTLTCPPNITIACSEPTLPAHTGNAGINDCSNTTTVVDDEVEDFGECGALRQVLHRKFIVTDIWGNQSICGQTITIVPFKLSDVVLPPDITVNCESVYLNPAATSPAYTGAPSINGSPIGSGGLCAASIGHWDEILAICAGSYEIHRNWKIGDACLPLGPNNPISYTQRIRVKDAAGPVFNCPAAVTVSTDPFSCCATAALPDMIVSEGCSHIINLEAKVTGTNPSNGNVITFTVAGHLEDFAGNNWWNPDTLAVFDYTQCLPLGTYNVRYKASDECTNTSYCVFQLTVADLVPPVAACDQTTVVAINGDDQNDCYTPADGCEGAGVTWVSAKTFDDGSHDNCNAVKFTVRRMAPYSDCISHLSHDPCNGNSLSEFGLATAELDSIKFYCCEVGTTQTVILRVYQVDVNGNFIPGTDGEPLFNECMVQVEVQDKIKPICQPPAHVTVACENFDPSLWAYGKATVLDNCCLDTSKVYQGQCGLTHSVNYAQFDTVCNKGTITRTFRAFDCHGLTSQCTQRIVVNYNQDYYVKFPNDVFVTVCDGTGNYGEPTFFGKNCELLGVSYEDAIFTVVPDACFKIERSWKIINWCTFNPNVPCIEVPNPTPNAVSNNPANLPGPIVSPIQTAGDPWKASNVKVNATDAGPTNYSVFYNPNANCYAYKQVINIIDTQDPAVECPASPVSVCDVTPNDAQLWNEMYWWDNHNQSHDLCEAPADICITASDACSGANVNIQYQLFLDLDNDGIMETVVNSTQLGIAGLGWNNVLFGNATGVGQSRQFDGRPVPANQKWGFAIQETVSGTKKTACLKFNTQQSQGTYAAPQLPYGTHKIKWIVSDGCGNETICEYTIIVKDCKAPTVVCLNGLSMNIMPTGMIQLWATDFLQYAEDNCTLNPYLKYGIRKCGQGTGFPVDGNGNPVNSLNFTCDEIGTQCVELWAIDLAGNADHCDTYVIVQDNNQNCGTPGFITVSGALKTEQANNTGEGVEETMVNVSGSVSFAAPFSAYGMSDNQGIFKVSNAVPLASDFLVTPVKDDNPLNGVSTYDLVLISKHILGIEPLGSPYKMIAADINKSNSITTFDIVELRKLILGIYQELPTNTSWRFVDKAYDFTNPANPFQDAFPESISVAQAQTHQLVEDFVGIKIGDVNNTVVANSLMDVDDRSAGTLLFDIQDRNLKAGETYEVTFKSSEKTQGYQMTLITNGLELLDIIGNDKVSTDNFGVFKNALTVSINGADAFTVKFHATKSGKLSEMLTISSHITKSEAYNLRNELLDIALRFNSPAGPTTVGVGFELYQNQPNPFVNKTTIGFHLPASPAEARSVQAGTTLTDEARSAQAGEPNGVQASAIPVTLSIFDDTGRLIYTQKGDFAKGYNTITLDRAWLNTTGALYYKLETETDTDTKKMIQVR